ncbi:hypothetical protein [Jiella avicenniae]|uniref:Uncharacterized protein n=1 Tax=Jiella avicenniae TaxID=2907202 RepID=A0A9X1P259_9HYPH|nr:hypothetical protein [Jiella avicenniae]MCE7028469.1 hypothetical protein [Jiella avicenniae]
MATITNKYGSPLTIVGVNIRPGASEDVPNWSEAKKNRTISKWIDGGIIAVSGDADPKNQSGGTSAYAVKDKGAGWYVITKDGAEVTKSLRKDAVEGFDAKTDEAKAAFVEANKAED